MKEMRRFPGTACGPKDLDGPCSLSSAVTLQPIYGTNESYEDHSEAKVLQTPTIMLCLQVI